MILFIYLFIGSIASSTIEHDERPLITNRPISHTPSINKRPSPTLPEAITSTPQQVISVSTSISSTSGNIKVPTLSTMGPQLDENDTETIGWTIMQEPSTDGPLPSTNPEIIVTSTDGPLETRFNVSTPAAAAAADDDEDIVTTDIPTTEPIPSSTSISQLLEGIEYRQGTYKFFFHSHSQSQCSSVTLVYFITMVHIMS